MWYNNIGDSMKTFRNMIPFFILLLLVATIVVLFIPKQTYTLKFENVTRVYSVDNNVNKKYNDKIVDLLDGVELTKNLQAFNGVYKFLYIKDEDGTKTLCIFDNGLIALKRGDDYYMINDKKKTDLINKYLKVYDVEYLKKPLFTIDVDGNYKTPANKEIKQQTGENNIRFVFNREISHLKVSFTDKVKKEETCVKEKGEIVCEYEYIEKTISNQPYKMNESEILDFKFNRKSYLHGLKIEVTDFNGEVTVVEFDCSSEKISINNMYIKEDI